MRKELAIIGSGLLCLHAVAQVPSATIPATAPTQSVSDLPSAHPPLPNATSQTDSGGEGRVIWTGSALTVEGNGDALPEILRLVARATGMKITGGVPDERVFGKYGPGTVQEIMAQLFDGLTINMLLINGSATAPKELVLTGRSGAASPPSVRAVSNDDRPARRSYPIRPVGPQGFGPPPQQPPQGGPGGNNPPNMPPPGSDATTSNAPSGSADAPASGGPRTPEQIFEELRKRQQQQQQPQN